MTRHSRMALGLFSLVLVGACTEPSAGPRCPDGTRAEGGLCVEPAGSISGSAAREDESLPAAGIRVALLGTDRVAVTDDVGAWAMRGVAPGRYVLEVSAERYRPARIEDVTIQDGEHTVVDPVLLLPEPAADAAVRGIVRTSAGTGADGAVVFLERTAHVTMTDGDGAFVLPGLASGRYVLVVRHEGHVTSRLPLDMAEGEQVELEPLLLEAVAPPEPMVGEVAGRVVLGETGAGAPGAQVYLEGTPHVTFTDGSGAFRIAEVASGAYSLGVLLPDRPSARVTGIWIEAGETTDVGTLTLDAVVQSATVRGVVREPDGAGAAGAVASLEGTDHVAVVGADGTFSVTGVGAGSYVLAVHHSGYETHRTSLDVVSGEVSVILQPIVLVEVTEPPLDVGRVSGTVLRGDTKQPAAGALAYVEGTPYAAFADRNGDFLIQGVPSGNRVLGVSLPEFRVQSRKVEVLQGETADMGVITLAPADAPVTGGLFGSVRLFGLIDHGGTQVTLEGPDGGLRSTTTDAAGAYGFSDVPEGLYHLRFEHAPWQPGERLNLGVTAGEYRVEEAVLRLGRRIDDRLLVEGVPVVDGWVMAWFEGAAAPELLDTATERRIPLPSGTAQVLAADPARAILLVHRPVLDRQVAALATVDLVAGTVEELSRMPQLLHVQDTHVVFSDEDGSVWDLGLGQAGPSLVATAPCEAARPSAIESGEYLGWMALDWVAWCGGAGGPYRQYYRTSDGALTPFIIAEAQLRPGHLLARAEVDLTASSPLPPRLIGIDLTTGGHQTILENVADVRFGARTLVRQSGGTTTYSGPITVVDPVGLGTVQLLSDAMFWGGIESGDDLDWILRTVNPSDYWAFSNPSGRLERLCGDPCTVANTGSHLSWVVTFEGTAPPYTVRVHDPDAGTSRVLSYTADRVYQQGGDGGTVLWRSGTTQWGHVAAAGLTRAICSGPEMYPLSSADGRSVALVCESAGAYSLEHVDLLTGTRSPILEGTAGARPSGLTCQFGNGRSALVCTFDASTSSPAGWNCGTFTCTVAFSAATGQRVLFPGDWSAPFAFTAWAPQDEAVAVWNMASSRHIRFGTTLEMSTVPAVERPLAMGPNGRSSLWANALGQTLMFAPQWGHSSLMGEGPTLNLPGSNVWLTDQCLADLATAQCMGHLVGDVTDGTVTDNGQALTWMQRTAYHRYSVADGLQTSVSHAQLFSETSRYYWDRALDTSLGTVYRRDPLDGRLEWMAEAADAFRVDLGEDRWLGFLDPSDTTDRGRLVYLDGPTAPAQVPAQDVSLATPLWSDPDIAPRVAFNGWTTEGLVLRVATLDGSEIETLGAPADAARISTGDGRVSFSTGGVWWHETLAPSAALPLDGSDALEHPLVYSPNGDRVLYGVGGNGSEATRRGTWLAPLP